MNTPKESLSSQFARVYGSPGEAPRVMGLLRAFWPLLVICFVTGYLLRALFPVPALSLSQVGVFFFLVAVVAAHGIPLVGISATRGATSRGTTTCSAGR